MDTENACLANTTLGFDREADSLGVPPSCAVCSTTAPCLFDVLADPAETKKMARSLPDIVTKMAAKLADVPAMCTGADSRQPGLLRLRRRSPK